MKSEQNDIPQSLFIIENSTPADWVDAQYILQAFPLISKRDLQTMRTKNLIPYAQPIGKIFYYLPGFLRFLEASAPFPQCLRLGTLRCYTCNLQQKIVKNACIVSYKTSFNGDQSGTEFLIEAKHAGEASYVSYSNEKPVRWYKKLYNQALQYYTAEQKYYLQQPTIVTITFEWARNQKQLKEVIEESTTDEYTDFCYLYHTNSAGLLIYGTYHDVNN